MRPTSVTAPGPGRVLWSPSCSAKVLSRLPAAHKVRLDLAKSPGGWASMSLPWVTHCTLLTNRIDSEVATQLLPVLLTLLTMHGVAGPFTLADFFFK